MSIGNVYYFVLLVIIGLTRDVIRPFCLEEGGHHIFSREALFISRQAVFHVGERVSGL